MPDRDEFGVFAAGLLIGGLAAGAAALLFAPQSGEKTRELIKEKSIELRDQAQMTAEEAMARAEAIAADARARGDEFARRVLNGMRQSTEVTETPEEKPTAV
jgi:gas vesicle protein